MRRVAERAEIGVMRRHNDDAPTGSKQPVEFLHGADHVCDVLDEMNGANLAKGSVAKRKREVIQVGDDVGTRVEIAIDADRARIFVDAAANI